jgi:hypothetical protein
MGASTGLSRGDGRLKTGDGRRKIEDGRRETEDRRRETGDRRQETEDRSVVTDVGCGLCVDAKEDLVIRKSYFVIEMTDASTGLSRVVGRQKTGDRRRETGDGRQKTGDGRRETEVW